MAATGPFCPQVYATSSFSRVLKVVIASRLFIHTLQFLLCTGWPADRPVIPSWAFEFQKLWSCFFCAAIGHAECVVCEKPSRLSEVPGVSGAHTCPTCMVAAHPGCAAGLASRLSEFKHARKFKLSRRQLSDVTSAVQSHFAGQMCALCNAAVG